MAAQSPAVQLPVSAHFPPCVLAQLAWGPFLPPFRSSGLCVSHKGLGAVYNVPLMAFGFGSIWGGWKELAAIGVRDVRLSGCLAPEALSAPLVSRDGAGCLLNVPGSVSPQCKALTLQQHDKVRAWKSIIRYLYLTGWRSLGTGSQ